ncbi:2Fe-2S iron-sulfur cluster binding domain-containing protein [Bradyrhizobium arachidis]|nr:2Fe-2S iron-sulfur cluster binding domain-containing protein [Bradyrhizobium arachidis]
MASPNDQRKNPTLDVEPDTPLLWAIHENAGLTGTKFGCGIAQCDACTVHMDGVATRSYGIAEAKGEKIITIEGLASGGLGLVALDLHLMSRARGMPMETPAVRP